jgi:hypothetical protein
MNRTHTLGGLIILLTLIVGVSVFAQVRRPFHNGSVWSITFVRMKPGMETAYQNFLAGEWKRNQEARKKDGLILSYKVISTEAHNSGDWNVMLMTEFKDLATMEASEDKDNALALKVIGTDEKRMQGFKERSELREIVGDRLAREMVLEPKGP